MHGNPNYKCCRSICAEYYDDDVWLYRYKLSNYTSWDIFIRLVLYAHAFVFSEETSKVMFNKQKNITHYSHTAMHAAMQLIRYHITPDIQSFTLSLLPSLMHIVVVSPQHENDAQLFFFFLSSLYCNVCAHIHICL